MLDLCYFLLPVLHHVICFTHTSELVSQVVLVKAVSTQREQYEGTLPVNPFLSLIFSLNPIQSRPSIQT